MPFWTRFSEKSTQFTPHYVCHENQERITAPEALVFVCLATESDNIGPQHKCSVDKSALKKIPESRRSCRKASTNDRTRFNIYSGKATFEPAGTYSDHNRHLMSRDNIGKFLFSVTDRTIRTYLPSCSKFIRSRDRRNAIKAYKADPIKRF